MTNTNPNASRASELPTSGDRALVAYSGPDGTPGDTIVTPASDRISVYVVRTGDTLSEIGAMFGVSVNTIVWANNLGNARDIHPGDTLVILPISGVERTVVRGDTLASLAKRYNADATEIAEYNGLDTGAVLVVNSTIIIPGGEIVAAPRARSSGTTRVVKEPYLGGSGAVESGYYVNPVLGGRITQGLHGWNGVDIGAARGTPIRAAASGTVVVARIGGGWNGGYGNYIVITHGNGTQTLYSHMTHAIVSPGQAVSAGQVIGYVGTTGLATGPHLHFEVRGAANPFRNCPVRSVCSPQ
ncbi:MAG: M23 family metallopeptidase [bacterium]|nr:M23 family metallopeptidase [bacterium]